MNFKRKNDNINLDQLVGKLQKEDKTYAKICGALQFVYWLFIPFYAVMAIIHYMDSGDVNELIGGLFYVIGFAIIAVFLGNYHKEYKYVDYSLPILKMLKDAAYRYQPVQLKSIWILIAILFIDAGLCINSSLDKSFIIKQVIFLGVVLISAIIGLTFWYFNYKPLRDNALRLIAEIEGE